MWSKSSPALISKAVISIHVFLVCNFVLFQSLWMLGVHLSMSYFFELCKKGFSAVIALSRVSSSTQIMELNCWKLDSNINSPDRVLFRDVLQKGHHQPPCQRHAGFCIFINAELIVQILYFQQDFQQERSCGIIAFRFSSQVALVPVYSSCTKIVLIYISFGQDSS